ncbi:MAG: acyloxyacyl hydrolase [Gammaproteobacteria bacterium]
MDAYMIKQNLRLFLLLIVTHFVLIINLAQASFWQDSRKGLELSAGHGKPSDLNGGRASFIIMPNQWQWWNGHLSAYLDGNISHWRTDDGPNSSISIVGINPFLRVNAWRHHIINPYLEGSIGIAALSKTRIGPRQLGAAWSFEDLVGVGLSFGKQEHAYVALRYLHFSNAHLAPPNDGIDVEYLVSVGYLF